jgi:hypothetical protein
MNNPEYTEKLENIIKQMLRPLKNIPFNLAIEAMTEKKVISFDFLKDDHKDVLELLKQAALKAGTEINKTGIVRSRPNEVGNDIENYIKNALNSLELNADIPTGPSGNKKAVGYPDIIFRHKNIYKCKHYTILSIEALSLDVKYEFNSDNKRLYSGKDGTIILSEGKVE